MYVWLVNPVAVDFVSARVGNYQYSPTWDVLLSQLWVRQILAEAQSTRPSALDRAHRCRSDNPITAESASATSPRPGQMISRRLRQAQPISSHRFCGLREPADTLTLGGGRLCSTRTTHDPRHRSSPPEKERRLHLVSVRRQPLFVDLRAPHSADSRRAHACSVVNPTVSQRLRDGRATDRSRARSCEQQEGRPEGRPSLPTRSQRWCYPVTAVPPGVACARWDRRHLQQPGAVQVPGPQMN